MKNVLHVIFESSRYKFFIIVSILEFELKKYTKASITSKLYILSNCLQVLIEDNEDN